MPATKGLVGAVHVDQVLGINAGDWLEWSADVSGFRYKAGVDQKSPDNPFGGTKKANRRSQTKMVEWLEVNNPAQLAKRKPVPDDTRSVADDHSLFTLVRRLITQAKRQDARSKAVWNIVYENQKSAFAEASVLQGARGATTSSNAPAATANNTRGAASSSAPARGASTFMLNGSAALKWHSMAVRTAFSEDVGLDLLTRLIDEGEPGEWVKALSTLDFYRVVDRLRRDTMGADAKFNEPEYQYCDVNGLCIIIQFCLDEEQAAMADAGQLKWICLMVWWAGLFTFDVLMIPMDSCPRTRDARGWYRFHLSLGIFKEPDSRIITNPTHRHLWLNKFIYLFRHDESRFVWVERPLDERASLH